MNSSCLQNVPLTFCPHPPHRLFPSSLSPQIRDMDLNTNGDYFSFCYAGRQDSAVKHQWGGVGGAEKWGDKDDEEDDKRWKTRLGETQRKRERVKIYSKIRQRWDEETEVRSFMVDLTTKRTFYKMMQCWPEARTTLNHWITARGKKTWVWSS